MPRILLVEDSEVDQQLVAGLIHNVQGWTLEVATGSQQALDSMNHALPDVVLSDMALASVDDMRLISQLREFDQCLPIVLLTSDGNEPMIAQALKMGATSFSPKSSRPNDLVRTIRHVIEMARHMQYTHDENFMPQPEQVAFVLENDLSLIGPLIERLQKSLPSWSDRDRLQVGMAMDEALVNAMHHGNLEVCSSLRNVESGDDAYYEQVQRRKNESPFRNRRVRFEAEFSDKHICVQISDEGPGFNPSDVPDPRCEENLQKLSGRGLFLIRSFMDQVAHNISGNQITMTKLRQDG